MSVIQNILFAIVIIIIVYFVYNYFSSGNVRLNGLTSGTKTTKISASKLPTNKAHNNFAYSIWFYVKDWQYRLNEPKELLERAPGHMKNSYSPRITLAPYENNIDIKIATFPSHKSSDKTAHITDMPSSHDCSIRNFPLQTWVNLIISLNGRTLDVYMDGKLVRTCVLPGVARPFPDADIRITPDGGFSGWTSNFQYWSNPLNPQEAYNVYKKGYGGGGLGGLLNKFQIKVAYFVNNTKQGSFTI
jgi:hypothetical protein